MQQVFDHNGHLVLLGTEIGHGGEGAVFEIRGQPNYLAKLYLRERISPNKWSTLSAKLPTMIQNASKDILSFSAWPVATLHSKAGGELAGFVMPSVAKSRDIHQLYSPAQRRSLFPSADWQFMVRTAHNCAVAFATLHKHGIVIGDVNQGNALVSEKAIVSLIDCDSFQINSNGRVYRCEVGVPHFTPPELQTAKLDQVTRTQNHDCFGLALLIFHLLFVGRHPFAGCYAGKGDMPIEKSISEFRFAYSRNCGAFQMSPPPFSLPLTALPAQIGDYFERAFGRGSAAPNTRPTAENWAIALHALEQSLRKCKDDSGHVYPGIVQTCPWCDIERAGGPNFFISVTVIRGYVGHGPQIDVAAIWAEILAIKFPDNSFNTSNIALPPIIPKPLPADLKDNQFLRALAGAGAVGGGAIAAIGLLLPDVLYVGIFLCASFFVWWFLMKVTSPINKIRRERQRTSKTIRSELASTQRQVETVILNHRNRFHAEKSSLEKIKASIDTLGQQRTDALQKLQAGIRDRQLAAYLDNFYISNANINKIGQGRATVLLSHGIETAADINERVIMAIPGFGPSLTSELVAWRRMVEGRFRFDPSKGVPQSEIQSIEIQYLQRKNTLGCQLQAGPHNLRNIVTSTKTQLDQYVTRTLQLEFKAAQAAADLKACG